MKVGIFVYFIPIGKSGGVQRYSEQLISALGKYSNIEVVVFCAPQNKEIFLPYAADKVSIIVLPKRCKYLRVLTNNRYLRQSPFFSALTKKIFYNRYSARIMDWLGDYKHMIEKKVDVIHFPYQVLDRYDFSIPTLITLHDLQQKYFPEFFTKDEIKERDTYFKKSAELCTRVIVSFEHVKKDIVNFYGISPKKIDVCSLGYDIGPSMDTAKFPEILKKYNIPEEYLFYSALTWKHKNHINLIRALKLLHNKYNKKIHLICTGAKSDFYPTIKSEIEKLGLEEYIIFTDFLPEEEFLVLLKKARLVVVPTLYEAGSYPLMEAMVYNVPVICSNVTSLPEQIGDERFIFDPHNIAQMADKMYQMITGETLRAENIENSKQQIKKLEWRNRIIDFIGSYGQSLEDFKIKKIII
ncbi:MAG: glycosyl transferase group 1 [Parcubacteria group bacterium GW2011_GWA2_33_14]|uniref:Glycosyl transferase family 1 domain-containing protein n=1 Tax=Candidatus Staskawiczbacteria bacterium RIFCSPHIGHO2_02_FULL_33_16 TaxID=1802204 RepID=A0A1G2HYA0_9BACT|nr:MAG: glycosyl transferase group 1 [Parcubacteria group bacterium GW2011_GWA2_33_14]OGZ67170.1 MAG: hypothetical protein A3D34_01445 [Candidatus Staskawiczbacteria bacterium RIFCSPHIGHO2_02_FULL_33_16]OGZ70726.1 MAG: hypothetical protein A2980_01360 [Candidatus Staskawiczbacteria bacterium RIFCSPLOWO2_01_FULL_33_13]